MAISTLFKSLGAPLVNSRWSWGASNNDIVLLRVWQDQTRKEDGVTKTEIHNNRDYLEDDLGQKERHSHIEEIRSGKPCCLVMCEAKKPLNPKSRAIKSYDRKTIFRGGNLSVIQNGDVFISIIGRMDVMEFRQNRPTRTL